MGTLAHPFGPDTGVARPEDEVKDIAQRVAVALQFLGNLLRCAEDGLLFQLLAALCGEFRDRLAAENLLVPALDVERAVSNLLPGVLAGVTRPRSSISSSISLIERWPSGRC